MPPPRQYISTERFSNETTIDSGISSLLGGKAGRALGIGLGTGSVTTEMAVDLKVTDVATGKIILADTVKGEAKQGESFSVAGIGGVSSQPRTCSRIATGSTAGTFVNGKRKLHIFGNRKFLTSGLRS